MTRTRSALPLLLAAGASAALLGASALAQTQTQTQTRTGGGVGSIVECDAKGGKQEAGALIGAGIGALVGSKVAKNEQALGAVAGAAVGAAAGSYVGCAQQRSEAAKGLRPYKGEIAGTYERGGLRLADHVQAAPFGRLQGDFVATSTVNMRSAPSVSGRKIGSIGAGQGFQVLASSGDWVLVGQDGVGVGYVSKRYARPA